LSYRGNRPTNKQTHTQTGLIAKHCTAKLSAQCNKHKPCIQDMCAQNCSWHSFSETNFCPVSGTSLPRLLLNQWK